MSCAHARLLARHSQFRYVTVCGCEGGVIHLSWDAATLHLSGSAFYKFKRVVSEMRVAETGASHLWVGSIGLSLSRADHAILTDLLDETHMLLGRVPFARAFSPPARTVN